MSRRAAGIALAAVFAAQLLVVITTAARDPHVDEIEYLHAGWLMKNGARLYTGFFEHHSPLLFAPLEWLAPRGEGVDVKPFAMRARYLAGACGLLALGLFASILWRIDPWAAVIAVSAIFSTGSFWLRVAADIRGEPLALVLFWTGILCAMRSRGVAGGIGIGLLVVAGLINPKWPLTSAFVAILWLVRAERRVRGLAAALGVALLGFAAIRALVPFELWFFHNFTVNAAFVTGRTLVDPKLLAASDPFLHAPPLFRPWVVAVAGILVLIAAWRRRDRDLALAAAFFATAALELRLVLPYPYLWTHYFAMWGFGAAALIGLAPRAVERIRFARPAVIVTTLLVLWANVIALWATGRSSSGVFWGGQRAIARGLRPGDTVWVRLERHPIAARDETYYWFNTGGLIEALGSLARESRELPVCDALRGGSRLRFVSREVISRDEQGCFDELVARGRLRRTGVPDVYEVLP